MQKSKREDALDKAAVFRHQFYEAASRLEEEQGKNLKLRAQINRDYENSSIPSSKAVRRKKITNNREKQAEDQAGSPATKGTAGKDRSLHSQLFFFHLKKCSKTVLLKSCQDHRKADGKYPYGPECNGISCRCLL